MTGATTTAWCSSRNPITKKKQPKHYPKMFQTPSTLKCQLQIAHLSILQKNEWVAGNKQWHLIWSMLFQEGECTDCSRSFTTRQKKTVVYLDLSDAFNSIEHKLILEALRQCKCPDWIVKLVESLYRDCTTIPKNVCGAKLCDPIKVRRGVRQGCPLSSLLFNLLLDPLLRCSSTEYSISLGYMNDIALIIEYDSQTATLLNKMRTMTTKLGWTFKAKKCGIANSAQTPTINDEILPRVVEERAYKYLGRDALQLPWEEWKCVSKRHGLQPKDSNYLI